MHETPNPVTPPAESAVTSPVVKKRFSWLPVIVLLTAFAVGFVPMWLKSSRLNAELFRVSRAERVQQIQLSLADAALDARRGEYEPARQRLTNFFTLVTTELNRGISSALPVNAAEDVKPLLAGRDDLITLLARSDPAAAERLTTAYAEFRKSLGK